MRSLRLCFSLIELLVVVAVIAILMSIILPALKSARERARDVACSANIGQVARGFLYYAADWGDLLPGGKSDHYLDAAGNEVTLDWLGVARDKASWGDAPKRGTIFRYVGDERAYVCPTHKLANEVANYEDAEIEHRTSVTAPTILTAAPIPLLIATRYPDEPWWDENPVPPRGLLTRRMMPMILAEEHTNWYLMKSKDSSWVTVDMFTDRHHGKGGMGFIDGHVEHRVMTRKRGAYIAYNLVMELADGRYVSLGNAARGGIKITFGWIRRAPSDR